MVERVDAHLLVLPVVRDAHLREHLPGVREVGIVDLQNKAGVHNSLVFFVHGVRDSK